MTAEPMTAGAQPPQAESPQAKPPQAKPPQAKPPQAKPPQAEPSRPEPPPTGVTRPRSGLRRRLLDREAPTGFPAALAWLALLAGALTPIVLATPVGWGAKFLVLLLFVCAAPGSAIVAFIQLGDAVAAATVALILSLSLSAVCAVTMVWANAWHPWVALLVLAALSTAGGAARLLPAVRVASRTAPPPPPPPVTAPSAADRLDPSAVVLHACLLGGALVTWVYALTQSSTASVGDYGLLPVMRPGFYTALVVCVLGFALALTAKRRSPAILVAYIVMLVLIMHATTPALLANPEYAWTFRHVGVIEFIRSLGAVDNPLDIYQEWPTFFALVAQMVSLSGAHTLTVAGWAPVFFDLACCLPLFAIARTLASDPRVPYLTVFLFTSINWVAQDYLSPQAFAFLLCLGILMIMLRWLRRMPKPLVPVRPRILGRLWAWLQDGLVEVPYTSKAARRLALIVLYFVYAVVVASHQLSPYLVAASAVSLVALGLIRPARIVPILIGIAIGYVVPRYQVVDNYGIFDGLNFLHNASGVGPAATAATITPGREFSVKVVETLALSIWGLTAIILFSRRRKLGPVALPGVLAFAPFVLLLAQSYGGEAIYRVFLFSSPWCAYLLAHQAMAFRWGTHARRPARGLARAAKTATGVPLLITMVLASMQGAHGQLAFDQFTSGEVAAAKRLYAAVPDGSDIVYAGANFPDKLTARYGDVAAGRVTELDLLDVGPDSDIATTGVPDIDAIDVYFHSLDAPVRYLVFSKSMIEYAHYFGYLPDGTLQTMSTQVSKSPAFELWYAADGVVVFRYIGDDAA